MSAETGSAQSGADGWDEPVAGGTRATSFLERALLRRRLRFLMRRRELALHDLGGYVFESHRLGQRHPEVESEKLAALDAIDGEAAMLQRALSMREEVTVLREPGISSCPRCRTIHDSAAVYCPGCGRATASAEPVSAIGDRCASCGATLAERQRWCLVCGAAAGTVLAATPNRWAARGAVAVLVALLALAGVGYAVATLLSS